MKYIFIDTNQYRHLFSKNEGFSDQISALIDRLIDRKKIKLLLPQQVRDEVERNRFEKWYKQEIDASKNKINNLKTEMEKREKDLVIFPKELKSIGKKLQKKIVDEEKELIDIKKRYRNLKSKANQKLKSLFDRAEDIKESDKIVSSADLRFKKGNPPSDNNLGDALIWESIIEYLSDNAEKGSSLIFVGRDGDAWGYDDFNPWLARELKEKTKAIISLAGKLSDIKELTGEEQNSLREVETQELKNNAISNFVNSPSFVSAGGNIYQLRIYKEILTKDDYIEIVDASISNNQIYGSFSTSEDLNSLCRRDDSDYVVNYLEEIEDYKWKKFTELNKISLKRQIDEKK